MKLQVTTVVGGFEILNDLAKINIVRHEGPYRLDTVRRRLELDPERYCAIPFEEGQRCRLLTVEVESCADRPANHRASAHLTDGGA